MPRLQSSVLIQCRTLLAVSPVWVGRTKYVQVVEELYGKPYQSASFSLIFVERGKISSLSSSYPEYYQYSLSFNL
jgi:hypothetical protein